MENITTYDLMNRHLNRFFPENDIFVFDEIESPDFHMDVYLIKPGIGRDFYTLITSGVSSKPMNVPVSGFPKYIELMLLLPASWETDENKWQLPENYWPIELIKTIGRFPHHHDTWLGLGHTIPEKEDSYLYKNGFTATMMLKSSIINEEFQHICCGDEFIDILMPIPLYDEEYNYKKEYGLNGFAAKMSDNEIPDIINLHRKKIFNTENDSWG